MNIPKLIQRYEQAYNNRLIRVVDEVITAKAKFIMVTGASCSGKTTTTKKLREYFAGHGIHAETISLDDFYLDHEHAPFTPDGKPDFETIDSLDLELLISVMRGLANGETVRIPRFDFKAKKRSEDYEELSLDEGEVAIIEGLHAVNPIIPAHIAPELIYKVYLYTERPDDPSFDTKLLRRIVRDSHSRATDATQTISVWQDVLDGEAKYIKPFMNGCNAVINTDFGIYETALLSPEGARLLSQVKPDRPEYPTAQRLASFLCMGISIPYCLVPDDSLMLEFINKT